MQLGWHRTVYAATASSVGRNINTLAQNIIVQVMAGFAFRFLSVEQDGLKH